MTQNAKQKSRDYFNNHRKSCLVHGGYWRHDYRFQLEAICRIMPDRLIEKTLSTLIQTNETYEPTQIDAFFESKPKIDAFLKIDANVQRQEYKMAS